MCHSLNSCPTAIEIHPPRRPSYLVATPTRVLRWVGRLDPSPSLPRRLTDATVNRLRTSSVAPFCGASGNPYPSPPRALSVMPCNQCQHRGHKADPNGDGFPLALLVGRQVFHTHINFPERSFRFDSMGRSLPLPMRG